MTNPYCHTSYFWMEQYNSWYSSDQHFLADPCNVNLSVLDLIVPVMSLVWVFTEQVNNLYDLRRFLHCYREVKFKPNPGNKASHVHLKLQRGCIAFIVSPIAASERKAFYFSSNDQLTFLIILDCCDIKNGITSGQQWCSLGCVQI